jgi:hypothetical protein
MYLTMAHPLSIERCDRAMQTYKITKFWTTSHSSLHTGCDSVALWPSHMVRPCHTMAFTQGSPMSHYGLTTGCDNVALRPSDRVRHSSKIDFL